MIDVSDVVNDPDFAQGFTIERSTGQFVAGGFEKTPSNVQGYGVISVAADEDIQMLPEGDRIDGAMVFHSHERIYLTQLDGGYDQAQYGAGGFGVSVQHVSDQIYWRGQKFRVMHVAPYEDYGYWRAIGVRMAGR